MFTRSAILMSILSGMVPAAVCVAQNPVSLKTVTSRNASSSGARGAPIDIYSADLNNDGFPDIIQDIGDSLGDFAVSIANGDGTFKAPVYYSYPAGMPNYRPRAVMAFGDFNGDGNVDLVAAFIATRTLAVFLGKGDGTFKTPKTYTLGLSGGDNIAFCAVVAADFNHDGKLDVILSGEAVSGAGTTARLYVLPGNGDGTFAAAQMIYSPAFPESAMLQLVAGDFDGDSNGDVAIEELYSPNSINTFYAVLVLYGDGHLGFTPATVTTTVGSAGGFFLGTGDLDGDGLTDIVAIEPNSTPRFLGTFYGRSDRTWTFNTHFSPIPFANYGSSSGYAPQIVTADFNDDGHTDFAVPAGLNGKSYWMFFLGTGTQGQLTTQTWNLPTYGNQSTPVAGTFNRDGKPDLAIVQYNCSNSCTPSSAVTASVITAELNYTAMGLWSNCTYPLQGRGIGLCSPTGSSDGAVTSPVGFNAAVHSFGQLRKMELWVDGKRLSQQSNVWESNAFLNFSAAITPGSHLGKVLASDIDNSTQQFDFNFSVGAPNCAPPSSDAVRICSLIPTSDAALVQASARVSGTLARMELWADGTKEYTETTSNNLSASVDLTPGRHKLTVVAANTSGMLWDQTVTVTVP
jgi:hypothetical protein